MKAGRVKKLALAALLSLAVAAPLGAGCEAGARADDLVQMPPTYQEKGRG